MTLRWISSVVVTILISASRLSTFHPALTQWMNLRRIYQISIVCLRPRRKHLEGFLALFCLIWFPLTVIARGIGTGTRYLTSLLSPPPLAPQEWTFSPTCSAKHLRVSSSSVPFFVACSVKISTTLSLWLLPTFTRHPFSGHPFRLWLSTVYFWAGETIIQCFFFLLNVLHNGSRITYNGAFGLFVVSANDLTAFVYAFHSQVARIWKPAQCCSACLYPNDLDANFCQAYGSQASPVRTVKPNKHINHVGITRCFQEFTDVSRNKPYQRQKSTLEQQLSSFLASLSTPSAFLAVLWTILFSSW